MHYSTLDYDDYYSRKDEYIENEMQNVRNLGFQKLATIVPHPKFIEDIALTLSYSFFEGHKSSERIVETLKLSKLELLSFQEEFKEFKELFLKDHEHNYYF